MPERLKYGHGALVASSLKVFFDLFADSVYFHLPAKVRRKSSTLIGCSRTHTAVHIISQSYNPQLIFCLYFGRSRLLLPWSIFCCMCMWKQGHCKMNTLIIWYRSVSCYFKIKWEKTVIVYCIIFLYNKIENISWYILS